MPHGIRPTKEIAGIAVHPAANMFPMMDEDELKTLREDIEKKGGIEHKILVDEEDRIVDGRNRWKVLAAMGVKWADAPKKVVKANERKIFDDVWSENFVRRHLSGEAKAAAILLHQEENGRLDKYEAEAKAEAAAAKKAGKPTSKRGALADKVAKDAGVSPAVAEKQIGKLRKGGKAALQETLENGKEERRGKGPRVKARMPNDPEGLAAYILENWTTGQVRKLVGLLTA